MGLLDVRNGKDTDLIQFGDSDISFNRVVMSYLAKDPNHDGGVQFIDEDHDDIQFATLLNKQHALDCIAAIQKAIELGWLE